MDCDRSMGISRAVDDHAATLGARLLGQQVAGVLHHQAQLEHLLLQVESAGVEDVPELGTPLSVRTVVELGPLTAAQVKTLKDWICSGAAQ